MSKIAPPIFERSSKIALQNYARFLKGESLLNTPSLTISNYLCFSLIISVLLWFALCKAQKKHQNQRFRCLH